MFNKLDWSSKDPNNSGESLMSLTIVSEIHAPMRSRIVRSEYASWKVQI